MSHLVTLKTKVRDPAAIRAACKALGLPAPLQGTAQLYSGEATGLIIQLPEWRYPAIVDVSSGEVRYDTFNGAWGNQEHLGHFLQLYAVEVAKLEAKKKGYQVTEQALGDGSIKVQIIEGTT